MSKKLTVVLVVLAFLIVSAFTVLCVGGFFKPVSEKQPISDAEKATYFSKYLPNSVEVELAIEGRAQALPPEEGVYATLDIMDGKYTVTYKDYGAMLIDYTADDGNKVLVSYQKSTFLNMCIYDEKQDLMIYISDVDQYQRTHFRKGKISKEDQQ